jgi:hypothetical protein
MVSILCPGPLERAALLDTCHARVGIDHRAGGGTVMVVLLAGGGETRNHPEKEDTRAMAGADPFSAPPVSSHL